MQHGKTKREIERSKAEFLSVSEAYDVLKDSSARARYDSTYDAERRRQQSEEDRRQSQRQRPRQQRQRQQTRADTSWGQRTRQQSRRESSSRGRTTDAALERQLEREWAQYERSGGAAYETKAQFKARRRREEGKRRRDEDYRRATKQYEHTVLEDAQEVASMVKEYTAILREDALRAARDVWKGRWSSVVKFAAVHPKTSLFAVGALVITPFAPVSTILFRVIPLIFFSLFSRFGLFNVVALRQVLKYTAHRSRQMRKERGNRRW